jgi:hypothetical protein
MNTPYIHPNISIMTNKLHFKTDCHHNACMLLECASPGWGSDELPLGPAKDRVGTETDGLLALRVQVRRGQWITREIGVASVKQAMWRHNNN